MDAEHGEIVETDEDVSDEADKDAGHEAARDRGRDCADTVKVERELKDLGKLGAGQVEQYACENKAKSLQILMFVDLSSHSGSLARLLQRFKSAVPIKTEIVLLTV